MKRFLAILSCFLFSSLLASAQEKKESEQGLVSTLRQKLKNVSQQGITIPDSLANTIPLDTLKNGVILPADTALQHYQDSIQAAARHVLDSMQSISTITGDIQKFADSIAALPNQQINKLNSEIDKRVSKITSLPDSAEQRVNTAIDNLNEKADNLEIEIAEQTGNLEDKVRDPVDQVNQKISAATKNIPGTEGLTSGTNIDTLLPIPETDLVDIPHIDIGELEIGDVKLDETSIPGLNLSTGVPSLEVPEVEVPTINELPTVLDKNLDVDISEHTQKLGEVDGYLSEAEQYEQELRKIKNGDLSELEKLDAEKRLLELDQVKAVNEEFSKAAQLKAQQEAMIQKYRDRKLLQEEIKRKAMNVANDHLKEMAPAVQKAQENLAKAKRLNPSIKSVKDIFKGQHNTMKDKPFAKRLVPGITLQAYNQDILKMDIGLQVGFRVSGKFTTGVGGIYRIGFSDQYNTFVNGEGVWGYRVYANVEMIKGIGAYGEFEGLTITNTATPGFLESEKNVDYAAYGGLGKSFSVSRRLKGSILVLYRFDWDDQFPSMSKFNVRAGIHWNMLARKKSTWLK